MVTFLCPSSSLSLSLSVCVHKSFIFFSLVILTNMLHRCNVNVLINYAGSLHIINITIVIVNYDYST
jgi:hypothetical protein